MPRDQQTQDDILARDELRDVIKHLRAAATHLDNVIFTHSNPRRFCGLVPPLRKLIQDCEIESVLDHPAPGAASAE